MLYASTRGEGGQVSSARAIKSGIASDGGLFVPASPVRLDGTGWQELGGMDYRDRASAILPLYLTDYLAEEISECVGRAYNESGFDHSAVAPLRELGNGVSVLELWHGPTSAFKDMALQIMPRLLTMAVAKTGERSEVVILVATSGDTGKAALEGFKDVPGVRIMVFFPDQGVSEIQKMQMITQEGGNVGVAAVRGNFDDAQNGVKAIFTDKGIKEELGRRGFILSSANSINWGRLAPQVVYYVSAYADLVNRGRLKPGDPVNFVVPTGNFGNILAGYYARELGLPVKRLICAANMNNVLTDFIACGVYDRNRVFHRTMSPSMDILVSSNLERLLFHLSDGDTHAVKGWMRDLSEKGRYAIGHTLLDRLQRLFWSGYASEQETAATIRETFEQEGYLVDTHTAVGLNVYGKYIAATGDRTCAVVLSTASPYKFNASVAGALLGGEAVKGKSEFELLNILADVSGTEIPANLRGLDKKPVRHGRVVEKWEMEEAVREFLLERVINVEK